jgi:hypothetical protein
MWKVVFVLPFVWLFSVAATITRFIGRVLPAAKLHSWLFQYFVGGPANARRVRDELISSAEEYLRESEASIEKSPDELVTEIENSRLRASTAISSGEFVLALFVGVAGFYVSPWLALAVSLVIALSASLRVTAVDSLAISSPDPARSPEWLLAALGWNKGAIEAGKILLNTALAVWMQQYDDRAFQAFVEEVFIPSLEQGGISTRQAIQNFAPRILDVVKDKG